MPVLYRHSGREFPALQTLDPDPSTGSISALNVTAVTTVCFLYQRTPLLMPKMGPQKSRARTPVCRRQVHPTASSRYPPDPRVNRFQPLPQPTVPSSCHFGKSSYVPNSPNPVSDRQVHPTASSRYPPDPRVNRFQPLPQPTVPSTCHFGTKPPTSPVTASFRCPAQRTASTDQKPPSSTHPPNPATFAHSSPHTRPSPGRCRPSLKIRPPCADRAQTNYH